MKQVFMSWEPLLMSWETTAILWDNYAETYSNCVSKSSEIIYFDLNICDTV